MQPNFIEALLIITGYLCLLLAAFSIMAALADCVLAPWMERRKWRKRSKR